MDCLSAANEQFVDENFAKAIQLYTQALEEKPDHVNILTSRAQAYIKQEQYEDAVADLDKALSLSPENATALLRNGVAHFHLKRTKKAKELLQRGKALGENPQFDKWLEKCDAKLKETGEYEETQEMPKVVPAENGAAAAASPADEKVEEKAEDEKEEPVPVIPMPPPDKNRYDWYQTETHVILTILIKNVQSDQFTYDLTDRNLNVSIKLDGGADYTIDLDLAHSVVPDQTKVKILKSKVELKLKKQEGVRWSKLEGDDQPGVKQFSTDSSDASTLKYPSSNRNTKDWDKLVVEIKEEEKKEKPEGDAALNQLFQQIYGDGNDEVKKAMNKSFYESGGTVLSTNWKEIGEKKTDIKPPDGMEYKKW